MLDALNVLLVVLDVDVVVKYIFWITSPGLRTPGPNSLIRVGALAQVPAVVSVASKYPRIRNAFELSADVV